MEVAAVPGKIEQGESHPRLGGRMGLVLLGVAASVLAATVVHAWPRGASNPIRTASSSAAFTEMTGVRLVRVAMSGNGGLIDLRFQAVDPEKALVVHDADQPIRIVDEATGQVISTPFHHHNGGRLVQGITYYELFNNSGGAIRRGGLVSVVIGGVGLEHVRVL
jgi:hypothetical protein